MTVSADDRWLADARARASAGGWERSADTIFAELRKQAATLPAARPSAVTCPACEGRPGLLDFPRYELLSADPITYCGACYGFWAVGDSLARGVADPGVSHPALEAVPAPRRCRYCFGHLKPDDTCAKCAKAPPALECPACGQTMQRFKEGQVRLDQCTACRGTWFDVGEIAAVYKLKPAQSLAMSTVDEHAMDDEMPGWLVAVHTLSRLLLPFVPL